MKYLKTISQYFSLLKAFGLIWTLRRVMYAIIQKVGLLKIRSPKGQWSADPIKSFYPAISDSEYLHNGISKVCPWFHTGFKDLGEFLSSTVPKNRSSATEGVKQGTFALMKSGRLWYFNKHVVDTKSPILWHRHPITETTISNIPHWSSINDFGYGDIKWFWEPSRFTFAFDLAREYLRTGNEEIPSFFWETFEDWMQKKPAKLRCKLEMWPRSGHEINRRLLCFTSIHICQLNKKKANCHGS